MIRSEFPEVHLITMPDNSAGACETFNIGFREARRAFTAIMDDDVVAPPDWLEKLLNRFTEEPATTAMISSKVVEPEMPESYLHAPEVNEERYMSTFRGCGTLVRTEVLARAGYYDEKFFIYGNERDLAARILNLGFRILQYPAAEIFHKTPFGMKRGKRSLYYHTRNFWLYAFKNCSWKSVFTSSMKLTLKAIGVIKSRSIARDATGTIGLEDTLRNTPGGKWVALKATLAAFCLLPYCLARRRVCKSPDFKPPLA
jgi:GT2 family glycosyltransferase